MSKFGELIDLEVPVLLDFYTEWNEASSAMDPVLKDIATALGDKVRVIKIDVDKNSELAEALRVKSLPTLMIFKEGEMMWRQGGVQEAHTLIALLQDYLY